MDRGDKDIFNIAPKETSIDKLNPELEDAIADVEEVLDSIERLTKEIDKDISSGTTENKEKILKLRFGENNKK